MTVEDPGQDAQVIAIDGPSGTGKSSVARDVARRLGARYLDTGAMYRALTFAVLSAGVDPADAASVADLARSVRIDISTDPERETVLVDGRDVTGAIRSPEVTAAVSAVSSVPEVRSRLVEAQRQLAGASRMVVEGRDIGTVVFASARLKIFLSAEPAARAARRARQLGITDPDEIAALGETLRRRDEFDSTRAASPLHPARDAVLVDSTDMSRRDVVEAILNAVTARTGSE